MSPDKPTDEQAPQGNEQAKPTAKAKPAAAKKPAAKKPSTKEPSAIQEPSAKKSTAKDGESATTEKKSSAKPVAKKPAEKAPVAKKESAAKGEKPDGEKKSKKIEKPAATATRESPSTVTSPARRKVVRAQARYVRTSARKARMVCGHLRGKSVPEARAILAFTPREVARDWSKLLESAVANAENNHELIEDDLFVREAYADEGPTIKRFRPRAQGRATPIRKRTSHLTITLTPKP
jgi:ribosomal protein L22